MAYKLFNVACSLNQDYDKKAANRSGAFYPLIERALAAKKATLTLTNCEVRKNLFSEQKQDLGFGLRCFFFFFFEPQLQLQTPAPRLQ